MAPAIVAVTVMVKRIARADVGQLVGNHRGDFTRLEGLQQAARNSDHRILRIAACSEGVGLVGLDDVDFRHRQAGIPCEPTDHLEQLEAERWSIGRAPWRLRTSLSAFQ